MMSCPDFESGTPCYPTTGPVDVSYGGQALESQQFPGYMRVYSMM